MIWKKDLKSSPVNKNPCEKSGNRGVLSHCGFFPSLTLWTITSTFANLHAFQDQSNEVARRVVERPGRQWSWSWKVGGNWVEELEIAGIFTLLGINILLMDKILHQLIGSLSHYLQGFIHTRRCRISSINSISPKKALLKMIFLFPRCDIRRPLPKGERA